MVKLKRLSKSRNLIWIERINAHSYIHDLCINSALEAHVIFESMVSQQSIHKAASFIFQLICDVKQNTCGCSTNAKASILSPHHVSNENANHQQSPSGSPSIVIVRIEPHKLKILQPKKNPFDQGTNSHRIPYT